MFSILPSTECNYKLFISDNCTDYIHIKQNIVYYNNRQVDYPANITFFNYPFISTPTKQYIIDENRLVGINQTFSTVLPLKILGYHVRYRKNNLYIGTNPVKTFTGSIENIAIDERRNDILNITIRGNTIKYEIQIYEKPILYYLQNKIEEDLKQIKLKSREATSTNDIITLHSDLEKLKEQMIERDREKHGTVHYANIDLLDTENIIQESRSISESVESSEEGNFKIMNSTDFTSDDIKSYVKSSSTDDIKSYVKSGSSDDIKSYVKSRSTDDIKSYVKSNSAYDLNSRSTDDIKLNSNASLTDYLEHTERLSSFSCDIDIVSTSEKEEPLFIESIKLVNKNTAPMASPTLLKAYENLKISEPVFKKPAPVNKKAEEKISIEKLEENLRTDFEFEFTDSFEKNYEKLRLNFASLDRRRRKHSFPIIKYREKNNMLTVVRNLENLIFTEEAKQRINIRDNIQYVYSVISQKSSNRSVKVLVNCRKKIDFYLKLNEFEIWNDFLTVESNRERKSIEDMLFKLDLVDFQRKKEEQDQKKIDEENKKKIEAEQRKKLEEEKIRLEKEQLERKALEREKTAVQINQTMAPPPVFSPVNYNTIDTTQLFSQQQVISQEPVKEKPNTLNKFSNKQANLLKKLSKDN